MANKNKTDWGQFLNAPEAAPVAPEAAPPASEAPAMPAPSVPAPTPAAASTPVQPAPLREVKYPSTYRLPADVLALIDEAVASAKAAGQRLTKEQAVAHAVRTVYGAPTQG